MIIKSERLRAFFLIGGIETCAYFILPIIPQDDIYLGVCGCFLALAAGCLCKYFDIAESYLISDLLVLTGIQVAIQMLGWANYEFSIFSKNIYSNLAHITVAATLLRFLIVRGNDRNIIKSHAPGNYGFYFSSITSFLDHRQTKEVSP